MKIGITIFAAMVILTLIALFGVIQWSTLGFIMALTIILVIIAAAGFLIVTSITKKSNNASH